MSGKALVARRRKSAGLAGLARAELVECLDGPARGQRRLEIDTPSGLAATLVVDRSLDVLSLRYRGTNLGWRSAARAAHPIAPLESDTGFGLMRSFDGLLVTCGLDHTGLPRERDADWLAYPPKSTSIHPLHGRLASAGVRLSNYGVDWDRYVVHAEAEVYQTGVFTEVLVLRRRIEIELEAPVVRVIDQVSNEGYRPTPHRLLYHVNIGYPLLDTPARLFGDSWSLADRLDDDEAVPSDDHRELVDTAPTPTGGFGIRNEALGLALQLDTAAEALPVTAVWRAWQSGIYALGIEPQTDADSSEHGMLSAGETRDYRIDLTVLAD